MSSIDNSSVLSAISAMEKQLAALRAQIGAAPAAAGSGKPVTEKKPRKEGPPSAWRLFADRVRVLLGGNGYSGKALGTECVQFCSSLKQENAEFSSWSDADILARRAAWTKPEVSKQAEAGLHWKKGKKVESPSVSAAASVVSEGEAEPASTEKKARKNPWAGLTEEQKAEKVAAMKAGRAAKKAASSEAAPAPAPAPAPAVAETSSVASDSSAKKGKKWSDEAKASAKAKREAKKAAAPAASAAAAAAVALPASPASSVKSGPAKEFQGIMLGGKRYLVNLESGHCYERLADGSQGDWAGLFYRTGGPKNGPRIDTEAAEPSEELTFLDE